MTDVSRAEFDAWTRRIEQNSGAVSAQAALAVQMTEVIKDVSEVRQDLRDHRADHEKDVARRAVTRRWAIGLGVALFAAVESPLVSLLLMHH